MVSILAAHHASNAGMLSVNVALAQILEDTGASGHFLNMAAHGALFEGRLRYRNYLEERILPDEERILGWGDFIHAPIWAQSGLRQQNRKLHGLSAEETMEAWYRLYMLDGIRASKVATFGSTLYTNRARDYEDWRYRNALGTLVDRADLTAFRDPVSVAQLDLHLDRRVTLGLDCAFLLDSGPFIEPSTVPTGLRPGHYIASFFARSGREAEQDAFTKQLARQAGIPIVRLSWFDCVDEATFCKQLSTLNNARYCVTDTYHLAVNALRDGIPTLCMAKSGKADRPIDDEKKRILLHGLGLGDYLINLDPLCADIFDADNSAQSQALEELVVNALDTLNSEEAETTGAAIRNRAAHWRNWLAAWLRGENPDV